MPLRDHFRPARGRWDALQGGWPMVIATDLNRRLPPPYTAAPRVHIGALEVAIAAFDADGAPEPGPPAVAEPAPPPIATAWTPPEPTAIIVAELPAIDEYEVRVYDTAHGLLVAAISLVSPANKDRPESRGAFVTKCATLLRRRVCVTIVDVVTTRSANLCCWPCSAPTASRPPRRPCTRPPAGGPVARGARSTRPGRIAWSWAGPCRPCPSGSMTAWPSRWTWKRPTRRPVAA